MSNSQIPLAAHCKESNLTHSIQVEMLFDGYARIKGLYEIWVPYLNNFNPIEYHIDQEQTNITTSTGFTTST